MFVTNLLMVQLARDVLSRLQRFLHFLRKSVDAHTSNIERPRLLDWPCQSRMGRTLSRSLPSNWEGRFQAARASGCGSRGGWEAAPPSYGRFYGRDAALRRPDGVARHPSPILEKLLSTNASFRFRFS